MKKRFWRADRSSFDPMVQWTGVVAVIVALGLLYVWQQVQTRDMKRDILRLEARRSELIQENSRLKVEVAAYASQRRIEGVTARVLGLDYAVIGQVVSVVPVAPEGMGLAAKQSGRKHIRFTSSSKTPTAVSDHAEVTSR